MKSIIPAHRIASRPVTDADIERVIGDGAMMARLCWPENALYQSGEGGVKPVAHAIAHSQIENNDPLRFFVLSDGRIIINPVIIRQVRHQIEKEEKCMTFPGMPNVTVMRSHKCEVSFSLLTDDNKIGPEQIENLSGLTAQIFQHEIDHMDAVYIYPDRIVELFSGKPGPVEPGTEKENNEHMKKTAKKAAGKSAAKKASMKKSGAGKKANC